MCECFSGITRLNVGVCDCKKYTYEEGDVQNSLLVGCVPSSIPYGNGTLSATRESGEYQISACQQKYDSTHAGTSPDDEDKSCVRHFLLLSIDQAVLDLTMFMNRTDA